MKCSTGDLAGFAGHHRFLIAYGIMLISALCLLPAFNADMQGDVRGCRGMADDLLAGKLPYREHVFEYPPYAIPLFLLPRLFGGGEDNYLDGFKTLAFVADGLVKLLLLVIGFRRFQTARGLLPLLIYSVAVPFLHFFYLQRYDVWPAFISLLAVWLFGSKHYLASGLAVAIGIGVKLYPVLFVPPLFILALREGKGRRFCAGLAFGLLPIALLSFYLPWWRFAAFQAARGLQVESLYASALWLGHLFGIADVHWTYTNKWYEVQGAPATAVLPWARGLFIAGVGGSTLIVMRTAAKLQNVSLAQIARLLLVPLLAFVAFNQVLSPQYMIWLLPLAALTVLEGNAWPEWAVTLATILTPIVYPSWHGDYRRGLDLFETVVLLSRNLLLATMWISFAIEASLKLKLIAPKQ